MNGTKSVENPSCNPDSSLQLQRSTTMFTPPIAENRPAYSLKEIHLMSKYNINGNVCVSFSGGSSSGFMLKHLLDHNDRDKLCVVFANTGLEHEATLEFVDTCSKEWNVPIYWVEYVAKKEYKLVTFETASRKGEPFDALIRDEKCLPNVWMRFCTNKLKIKLIATIAKLHFKDCEYTECIGIRYDEPKRWTRMLNSPLNKGRDISMPMFDSKHTLTDVTSFWETNSFRLQIPRELSNCQGCFLKGTKTLRKVHELNPDSMAWWVSHEKRSGKTFRKGQPYANLLKMLPSLSTDTEDDLPCSCTE